MAAMPVHTERPYEAGRPSPAFTCRQSRATSDGGRRFKRLKQLAAREGSLTGILVSKLYHGVAASPRNTTTRVVPMEDWWKRTSHKWGTFHTKVCLNFFKRGLIPCKGLSVQTSLKGKTHYEKKIV